MEAAAVDGRSRGGAADKRNRSGRCLPRGMEAAAAFAVDRPSRGVGAAGDGGGRRERRLPQDGCDRGGSAAAVDGGGHGGRRTPRWTEAAVAGVPRRMEEADADGGSYAMGAAEAGVPQWMEAAVADGGSRGGWTRRWRGCRGGQRPWRGRRRPWRTAAGEGRGGQRFRRTAAGDGRGGRWLRRTNVADGGRGLWRTAEGDSRVGHLPATAVADGGGRWPWHRGGHHWRTAVPADGSGRRPWRTASPADGGGRAVLPRWVDAVARGRGGGAAAGDGRGGRWRATGDGGG